LLLIDAGKRSYIKLTRKPQGNEEDKKMSIRIGILGYGNLGRGVECAIKQNPDMELAAVFTRRDPASVKILTEGASVYSVDDAEKMKDKIDVLIICGGSATDLPKQTPKYAQWFNVVDSFDTHARIPEHFANVDKAAGENGHVGIISVGWDPGMFSLNRMYANAILSNGHDYTFWGKGVSQGHSDAIRRIDGVKDGKQYTIPVESALEAVRSGKNPELTTREKHTRECFVVAEEGADLARIEREIKTMPNYFDEYDTTVHFISEEELKRDHSGIPHGGFVIRTGKTGWNEENSHVIEYSLKLDSNPEFTASVIVAYARAAYRMSREGQKGAKTVFDVAPAYLSALDGAELLAHLL
jgi:diaminopimelate dehydrogenase